MEQLLANPCRNILTDSDEFETFLIDYSWLKIISSNKISDKRRLKSQPSKLKTSYIKRLTERWLKLTFFIRNFTIACWVNWSYQLLIHFILIRVSLSKYYLYIWATWHTFGTCANSNGPTIQLNNLLGT